MDKFCVKRALFEHYNYSFNGRQTYLHANLIEHKASSMTEETIPFPAEFHHFLLVLFMDN